MVRYGVRSGRRCSLLRYQMSAEAVQGIPVITTDPASVIPGIMRGIDFA